MSDKFINTKNLIWTISVIVCLLALIVGFVYAAVNKYYYDHELPVVNLGTAEGKADKNQDESAEDGAQAGVLNELRKSKADSDYIQKLTFLCDSVNVCIVENGADSSKVWNGTDGSMKVNELADGTVLFPGDGSSVTVADAAMISKPEILIILVGTDGLSFTDEETFKAQYGKLISSVLASSADTQIVCCSIASVTAGCVTTDGLTIEMVSNANEWLKSICSQYAVWYADTASEICQDGYLKSEFASSDGRTLNSNGACAVLDYLESHALS